MVRIHVRCLEGLARGNASQRRQLAGIVPGYFFNLQRANRFFYIQTAMKSTVCLVFLILFACGGSLSDEQRKQVREKMEMNKIVRVTEVTRKESS